jgi:hypothetical protein
LLADLPGEGRTGEVEMDADGCDRDSSPPGQHGRETHHSGILGTKEVVERQRNEGRDLRWFTAVDHTLNTPHGPDPSSRC